MDKEKELVYKRVLGEVLSSEFRTSYFSINGYGEDAVCLEKKDDAWVLFYGFRNMHKDEEEFSSLLEACLEMICILCNSDIKLRHKLTNSFLDKIYAIKSA